MKIYTRNMHQDATLFKRTGVDRYGQPSFESENIKCRWQDVAERFLNAAGEEFVSRSIIYPAVKVDIGDRLALGKDAELGDAKEVKYSGSSPSLRGSKVLYKAAI